MLESPLVNPEAIIVQAQPGQAMYARNQLDQGTWEVSWLIREASARIAALHQPDIEFRAGAIEQRFHGQIILLIPILVRIGPERQEHIFETFLNVFQTGGGLVYLHDLTTQERIVLHCYGDQRRRERSLVITNQLKTFAVEALQLVERFQPWDMHAFDRAREHLYHRYPTVMALWRGLSQ